MQSAVAPKIEAPPASTTWRKELPSAHPAFPAEALPSLDAYFTSAQTYDMLERTLKLSFGKPIILPSAWPLGTRPGLSICPNTFNTRNATSSSIPNNASATRRKAVTVINDTGRVPWENLTVGEKAARATQQTFNFGIVLVGIALTGGIATVLWLEVFSTDSKTAYFNKAADRVRSDPKCRELLAGDGLHSKRDIKAYGEPSWSRWARNRTIASRFEKDRAGIEHLHMHFYVEGRAAKGTVNLHMSRREGEEFEYQHLSLDVPGQPRYYLENANKNLDQRKQGRMFGVRWN